MLSDSKGFQSTDSDSIGTQDGMLKSTSLSFGQKLVGINFNPSADDQVGKAKKLFAEIADLVHTEMSNRETSPLSMVLQDHTIGEILNAQMNVVKLLTLKY